jgi:ribosomal protein L1
MPKAGKKYEKAAKTAERKLYTLDEAVSLLKKIAFAKFDETVEISMRLGVDPKHADQMVRGTVVLPNGAMPGPTRPAAMTSWNGFRAAGWILMPLSRLPI